MRKIKRQNLQQKSKGGDESVELSDPLKVVEH